MWRPGHGAAEGGEFERSGHYFTSQSAELGEGTGEKYRVKVAAFHIDIYKVSNADYCRFLNADNPGYWNWTPWNQSITRDETGQFLSRKVRRNDRWWG